MVKEDLFGGVYRNKRVLITGDTGFKGSWLAIWLKELGAEVFGLGLPPKTKRDNFVICGLDKSIIHKEIDIREYDKLFQFFQEVNPEFVFHLAAQPLVLESYKDPKSTFESNVLGTVNVFECVRQTKAVKVLINVTSDKCYKNVESLWGYRETDPMGGKDPYSASKGAAEIVASSYIDSYFSEEGTCNVASVRAGNVIGAGDWAENRIIPDFFRALISGAPIELRYPKATRPWQHVLEPLSGYLLLGKKLHTDGKVFSGGWNFGPNIIEPHTVGDVVEILNSFSRNQTEVIHKSSEFHEATLLTLDTTKARKFLGWSSTLDYKKTIEMTAKGYLFDIENPLSDFKNNRIEQIKKYTELITWNGQ